MNRGTIGWIILVETIGVLPRIGHTVVIGISAGCTVRNGWEAAHVIFGDRNNSFVIFILLDNSRVYRVAA